MERTAPHARCQAGGLERRQDLGLAQAHQRGHDHRPRPWADEPGLARHGGPISTTAEGLQAEACRADRECDDHDRREDGRPPSHWDRAQLSQRVHPGPGRTGGRCLVRTDHPRARPRVDRGHVRGRGGHTLRSHARHALPGGVGGAKGHGVLRVRVEGDRPARRLGHHLAHQGDARAASHQEDPIERTEVEPSAPDRTAQGADRFGDPGADHRLEFGPREAHIRARRGKVDRDGRVRVR